MKSLILVILLVLCVCHSHNKLRRNHDDDDYGDSSWDWRDHFPISSVDNELITNCSSSYIFAALGGIEGLKALTNGDSAKLSAQEYLDCSSGKSCSLGSVSDVIEYYSDRKVCKSSSYEYNGRINECKSDKCDSYSKIKEVSYRVMRGEEVIKGDVHVTPVPTKIYIDSLRDYKGGIYKDYDACNHEPNHWVLVVGYGVEGNDKYWIIKNDFGIEWGEKGYLRLERGKGMCGIGKESYVLYYEEWKDYAIALIVVACVVGVIMIICCCLCCIMCITGTTFGIGSCCCKRNRNVPPKLYATPNTYPTVYQAQPIRVN